MNQQSWFNTAERVERLRQVAESWKGTPWCPNSDVRGVGVACHLLPTAMLIECGALPAEFPRVKGLPGRHVKESAITKFMDGPEGQKYFQRIQAGKQIMPGDVLGIRIYGVIDHMGIVLDEFHFAHVLMRKHTQLDDIWRVSPWLERTEAVWRTKNG